MEVIDGQWDRRRIDYPYAFHRAGKCLKEFRGSGEKDLAVGAVEGKIVHDLRRTAIRNTLRESVAMRS
jgi:hypothetical protein